LRNNELLTTPAVADTAETKTETRNDNVSIYKFGKSTYIVETVFNLDCKDSLEDVINRLIIKDIEKLSA